MILEAIGLIGSALCSITLGTGASGFIIGLATEYGFSASSPWWCLGLVYGSASIIGVNAAYRIWRVAKVGTPAGLRLIFNKENPESRAMTTEAPDLQTGLEMIRQKRLELTGIVLSFAAGTTYGGLAYLGIANISQLESLWGHIISGIVIIGSNAIGSGGLFSYAWIQNIRNKTLIYSKNSAPPLCSEIISSLVALFGLGCTMTLGGLGLAKSLAKLPSISNPLGGIIAVIGFFGEAPFTIKQGRLLVAKCAKARTIDLPPEGDILSLHATGDIKSPRDVKFGKIASIALFTTNSFCGTYKELAVSFTPARVTLALGSAFLSLVSCLEETERRGSNTASQALLADTETGNPPVLFSAEGKSPSRGSSVSALVTGRGESEADRNKAAHRTDIVASGSEKGESAHVRPVA